MQNLYLNPSFSITYSMLIIGFYQRVYCMLLHSVLDILAILRYNFTVAPLAVWAAIIGGSVISLDPWCKFGINHIPKFWHTLGHVQVPLWAFAPVHLTWKWPSARVPFSFTTLHLCSALCCRRARSASGGH